MKKTLILIVLSVFVLCSSGCSGQGGAAAASQGVSIQETPNIIYVTATEETANIIYVTATPGIQGSESKPDSSLSTDLLKGKIVFSKFLSQEPMDIQVFVMNLSDGFEKQITSTGINSQPMWSPDGTKILYTSTSDDTLADIFIMDEDGGNAHAVVSTKGVDANGVWSPDGKMLAYNSDVDGNAEIYTIHLETNEIKQITSTDGGYHGAPSWSPDGKKLVYVYGEGTKPGTNLIAYDVASGASEEIDADKFYLDDLPIWAPDGQHVIFQRMNGDFNRIIKYDVNQMKESLLTEELFPGENMENRAERSARGNYVSFSVNGKFYVMDMDQRVVYTLGVEAMDLNYFPE